MECREFRNNFDSIWLNLRQKIVSASPIDGPQIFYFIHHLNQRHKVLLLLGGLQLPFDRESVTLITRFICSAVNKRVLPVPSICEALNKYDLFHYFQSWLLDSSFPSYSHWKSIVKTKIRERESREKLRELEAPWLSK